MGIHAATPEVPAAVLDYLADHHTLTLATSSPTGIPHAATLLYVNDDLALYCWIRPDTTTARHIEANPAVAFTIDEYSPDWTKTKGIQGSGECQVLLAPAQINDVIERFRGRFPQLQSASTSNVSFLRIAPSQVHFIDNEGAGEAGKGLGMSYHRSLVFSIFGNLPHRDAATVAARLDTVHVEAGTVIVRQGAPADKFFIIVDGEVAVTRDDDGQSQHLATLGPGQFFGEMAILRDAPRNATVQATTPTTLLTLDRDTFRGLVAQSLSTTQDFHEIIQQRLGDPGRVGSA